MDAIGHVTLTALSPVEIMGEVLQTTTDPDKVLTEWDTRKVTEAGLEGVQTTQDWGTFAVDCYRTLTWNGRGQYLDGLAVRTLRRWLRANGGTFRYEDALLNDEWTVEIVTPFQADLEFGLPDLFTASLRLHALGMTTLMGELYDGN